MALERRRKSAQATLERRCQIAALNITTQATTVPESANLFGAVT
jgi:hypothetical protein